MNTKRQLRKKAAARKGGAAIEAALVSPVLVIILLGAIDIGQYVNVAQSVSNASREGARVGCRNSVDTVSDIEDSIVDYLHATFPYLTRTEIATAADIEVRDETNNVVVQSDVSSIASGDIMSVTVEFDFDAVRWLQGIDYWDGQFKTTRTVVRRE